MNARRHARKSQGLPGAMSRAVSLLAGKLSEVVAAEDMQLSEDELYKVLLERLTKAGSAQ